MYKKSKLLLSKLCFSFIIYHRKEKTVPDLTTIWMSHIVRVKLGAGIEFVIITNFFNKIYPMSKKRRGLFTREEFYLFKWSQVIRKLHIKIKNLFIYVVNYPIEEY